MATWLRHLGLRSPRKDQVYDAVPDKAEEVELENVSSDDDDDGDNKTDIEVAGSTLGSETGVLLIERTVCQSSD